MAQRIKGIVGVEDAKRELNALAKRVRTSVLRKGMTAGLAPILAAAKSKCPVRDPDPRFKAGLLRKSLGKKVKQYANGSIVVGLVGARNGFRRVTTVGDTEYVQDPTKYDRLVEFGTRQAGPRPFLRPAGEAGKANFVQAMTEKMNEAIAQAGKK